MITEPEHNPEHGRVHRGSKKQRPNGQGARAGKSRAWRTTITIEPTDLSKEALTWFDKFCLREISPSNTEIHSMSAVKWSGDGERKRPYVIVDITNRGAVSGNQRGDLQKKLRTMCDLKRLTSQDGRASWLLIKEVQHNIKWEKAT